jgi:hypothetical protein
MDARFISMSVSIVQTISTTGSLLCLEAATVILQNILVEIYAEKSSNLKFVSIYKANFAYSSVLLYS